MADLDIIKTNLIPSDDTPLPTNDIMNCIIIDSSKEKYVSIYDMNEKHKLQNQIKFTHHFFIEEDGVIYEGRTLDEVAYIDEKFNKNCIGIMLQGDFNKYEISDVQLNTLIALIFNLRKDYPNIKNNIYLHSEINKNFSDSPGTEFPYIEFRNKLYMNFIHITDKVTDFKGQVIYELGSRVLEYKIPNMIGTDVYQFKLFLIKLGYDINNIDGVFDKELKIVLKQFYEDYNLGIESYESTVITKEVMVFIQELLVVNKFNREEKYKRCLRLTNPPMSGPDIRLIKSKLFSLGLLNDTVNLIYNDETALAVGRFQAKYNYEITQEVSSLTFNEILKCEEYSFSRVIEMSDPLMEGPDILLMQNALFSLGYNVFINGFYDIKTYNAVVQFQINNNLMVDGRIDEVTFNEILKLQKL